ncbi:MAG: cobaltochelatase subunit CobN [Methanomicrobiales archaeon]
MITFVFALMLCGGVAAEDSQGGNLEISECDNNLESDLTDPEDHENNDKSSINSNLLLLDPEITLNINLEHPEALSGDKLPEITVKDVDGTVIDDLIITKNSDSQYKINFISDKDQFNITVAALAHVPQEVNVSVDTQDPADPVKYGEATIDLRAYTIMLFNGSESYAKNILDAFDELREEGYYFNLYYFFNTEVDPGDAETDQRAIEAANKADIIAVQMISSPSTVDKIMTLIAGNNAQKILAIRCGVAFVNKPNVDSDDTITRPYWDQGATENFKRFQLYLLQSVGMQLKPGEDISIVQWPSEFIHHPDSEIPLFVDWEDYLAWYAQEGHLNPDAPWVGLVAYDSSFKGANHDMYVEILRELEDKGLNVILAFASSAGRVNCVNNYFTDGSNARISALIACFGFNIVYGKPEESLEVYKSLNVPVFAPIYAADLQAWENSSNSMDNSVYWQVAQPEMEGRIEPIFIGGVVDLEKDPETGITIKQYTPLPDRIERISERVYNWIQLSQLPNQDKKLALLYYNIGGGKDGVNASYLNVIDSISEILIALRINGYDVPEYTRDEIEDLILNAGNNVGTWAPGELEKVLQAGALTIPVSDYILWFNSLPEELKQEVINEWGPAPGNVMVYGDQIVIPGIMLGNLFLGPQPMRGWGENPEEIRHSTTLPPHHQYIAFYMWLQNQFMANAVIHLGTHGTLEWLPGRSVGLGGDDWPDVLLGNIPNIYPYIVENPGEGTQAKRRGYAVIIDHNIPPMICSGLYGDLANLNDLINSYETTTDKQRKAVLQAEIIDLIIQLNLDQQLYLDLVNTPFDDVLDVTEHSLEDIAETLMPYGLHTFGVPLDGELLDAMIESIVSFNPEERDNQAYRESLREKLIQNYEIGNLLLALSGEFVPADLAGSPIRKPDVLPTGMNFYSFDPRTAPDTAAWKIGKQMADDLLTTFFAENGHYPEQVGVVLWSIETMRTNGQTIAMILRLMGAEPDWKSGRFNGIKVTPLSELNRPRVDVLVTISGLFRDTFSYSIEMLDDAFRQIMALDETDEENYLKKHYQNDLNTYLASGMTQEDAKLLAGARIYGPCQEAYGTGVSSLVPNTTGWDDQSDLVDTYLSKMSYIYGRNTYAVKNLNSFTNQLSNVEATVQIRDGTYATLDNDDVYQYLGGLSMAVNAVSDRDVSIYIANTRLNPRIEAFDSFLATELRTRIYNPKWIEGMLNEGFSGANEISSEIGHLFGWSAVTPDSVKDWMWQEVAETYVFNDEIRNQFIAANPHAFKSTVAWMLEAIHRNMWNADLTTTTRLANSYLESNIKYGVTCCHHTCANLAFNQWLVQMSSLSPLELQQFNNVLTQATGKSVTLPGANPNEQSTINPGSNPSTVDVTGQTSVGESSTISEVSVSDVGESQQTSESAKSYEVSKSDAQSSSQSGLPAYALVGVVLIVGLIGFGYFRGLKKI